MFGFFSKKQGLADFSEVGVDMHSHLLPGIDDGAPDLATSLELIKGLSVLGYRHLITTPHIMNEVHPNTRDVILRKEAEVQEALLETGIPVTLQAAAEYYVDEAFVALMAKERLLTLPGNRVLIEQSMIQAFPDLMQVIFDLQMKGYRPVLAHPERYAFYTRLSDLERFTDRNVELQVNLLSLSGYYGAGPKKMAKALVDQGLVSFLGTDLHHPAHLNRLKGMMDEPLLAKAAELAINNILTD